MKANNLQCYFDYVFNDISLYRQLVFEKLILHIQGGFVADIGCGSVGWYWALGYIDRVEQVSFIDINKDYLESNQIILQKISPQWVYKNIESSVNYIQKTGGNIENACQSIHTKPIIFSEKSISSIDVENKYDYVVAIESLEIVETKEEFLQNLQAVYSALKPGGKLFFSILPYEQVNESVRDAQNADLEGMLNPNYLMTERCIKKVGFEIILMENVEIPEHNYSNTVFGRVAKPLL